MIAIFKKKKPPLVGVDITSSAVKVLELSKSGKRFRVDRFAVEPLPQGAVVESAVADIDEVGRVLERALRRSGSKRKHAAVAVASSHVITKTIGVPGGLKPKELEDQVEMEAENYIPYPLDEVNLDFEVIGPAHDNPNEDDLLLTACRREIVDGYMAVVEGAGLIPAVVDVDAFAIENVIPLVEGHLNGGDKPASTLAVMDFGVSTTRTIVFHDGRSVYTRDQAFGGKQLADEAMRRFDMSEDELRQARLSGELPAEYYSEIVEPFVETMGQEINRALQFFFSASTFDGVDHVLLSGGCAQIPGVETRVSESTGLPASVLNPFVDMALASRVKPQLLQGSAPSLAVACGLAIRNFES